MDLVLIAKALSLLIYPVGLISVLLFLALLYRLLQKHSLSIFCISLALVAFLFSSNNYVAKSLVTSLEQQYPQLDIENTPSADVIIVLGGSLAPPATPRKFSQFTGRSNRFWLAGKLYLAGKAQYIILSGGNVFQQTGLQSEAHKKIGQLSKGYRQRVGLATTLIHNPTVLILDEPTTGLDPNQLVEIRELIKNVGKEKTVLLSTHIMQEVEAICDRVIILNKGTIVADKKLAELRAQGEQIIEVEFDYRVEDVLLQQ